jgi:methylthioribose-1-phosphate isomerase
MGDGNIDFDCSPESKSYIYALKWENNALKLIDQKKLPFKKVYVSCRTAECVAEAIKSMVIRGAPAIGVAAAYGVALAALNFRGNDREKFTVYMNEKIELLAGTRPTGVNLFHTLDKMKEVLNADNDSGVCNIRDKLIKEAIEIEKHEVEVSCRIGMSGAEIFRKMDKKIKILTHCNAGALAAPGYGTALSVIRSLYREGKLENVIVDETRPILQGARLTASELSQDGIPFFIITDNMAGYFMSEGEVDAVLVGADRIAVNGDTANKIGTLSLSILAKFYNIPFYVAAPISTVDIKIKSGDNIPIENRDEREVREISGKTIIPEFMPVKNPAFDVTPAGNITAIITENGIIYPPYEENIAKIFNNKRRIVGSGKRLA